METQSPQFHIEKLQPQVESTPRDLKLDLEVKLGAKNLEARKLGLTLPAAVLNGTNSEKSEGVVYKISPGRSRGYSE